jgi:lactoylglutathione lyase
MVEMASLVLFSAAMDETVAFYRAMGLEMEEEDHGEGPVHFATEVDGVHFAVFGATEPGHAPAWQHAGSVFAGFYVASLVDTVAAVRARGALVLVEHQIRPWGCRAVVADPDGRPVEINQRGHCNEVTDT